MKTDLDHLIIYYFYSGLSISDISRKMKNTICSFVKECNKPADVKNYVNRVIYNYQMNFLNKSQKGI